MSDITVRLKEVRALTNLSQVEFAGSMGIAQSSYKNYERGITDIPIWVVISICVRFNVSADWFLLGKGDMYHTNIEDVYTKALNIVMKFLQETHKSIDVVGREAQITWYVFELMKGNPGINSDEINKYLKTII